MAELTAVFFGLSSGLVLSGAAFAFITVIGIVPHMAERTDTTERVRSYENAITVGGIAGTLITFLELKLPVGNTFAALIALCSGVFFGALAMSLAEVLDVIPVLTRRVHVRRGIYYFILALAVGKLIGSLMYYLIPGYFTKEG